MISPNAEAIYQKAEAMVDTLDSETCAPGLLDQYVIMLERLKPGSGKGVGFEFVSIPGFISLPSKSILANIGSRSKFLRACRPTGTRQAILDDRAHDQPYMVQRHYCKLYLASSITG